MTTTVLTPNLDDLFARLLDEGTEANAVGVVEQARAALVGVELRAEITAALEAAYAAALDPASQSNGVGAAMLISAALTV